MTWNQASEYVENNLDFVYIDAQHHYEAVKIDIEQWYPKVKKWGMLAWHDYLNGVIDGSDFGVKKAVDEFAKINDLQVYITQETEYPSWYIIKS